MKLKLLAGIATVAIAVTACSLGSSIPFSSSSSTSNKVVGQAVNPNTQPIPVTTTLDQSHAVTDVIGPNGGTLSATGADGSKFTLEIPPKALVETIEVSMIPISSMDGFPWKSGPVAAVQLEPDGQTFYDYVTLTIQPADDIPANQFIPIGASGPNHDLYMPAVDPKSNTIQLKLDHFSSAGATKGLLADTEPWRERLGGDVEARLNSLVAAELLRERDALLNNQDSSAPPGFWDEIMQTWREQVLKPRLDAAKTSCAAGRLVMEMLLGMERQAQLGGWSFDPGVDTSQLYLQVGKQCIKEEYELCRDQHIIHRMIPLIISFERQDALWNSKGVPDADTAQLVADMIDKARKCLHFELQFESTAKMSTEDGSYTSTMEATIPIEFNPDTLALEGTADLNNTDFSMKPKKCKAQTTPGGGTFQVISLVPIDAPPDAAHPYGYVKAIHLTYAPGNSSETVVEVCPSVKPVNYPPMHLWTLAYEALHAMETAGGGPGNSPMPNISGILGGMGISNLPNVPGLPQIPGGGQSQGGSSQSSQDNGPTFLAKEWAVRGGDLFASKQWDLTVNMQTTGEENGTFKLYHKPQ